MFFRIFCGKFSKLLHFISRIDYLVKKWQKKVSCLSSACPWLTGWHQLCKAQNPEHRESSIFTEDHLNLCGSHIKALLLVGLQFRKKQSDCVWSSYLSDICPLHILWFTKKSIIVKRSADKTYFGTVLTPLCLSHRCQGNLLRRRRWKEQRLAKTSSRVSGGAKTHSLCEGDTLLLFPEHKDTLSL